MPTCGVSISLLLFEDENVQHGTKDRQQQTNKCCVSEDKIPVPV